jgi:hypothetical protein
MRPIILLALILSPALSNASEPANFSKPLTYFEYAAYTLIAGETSVFLHEGGHYVTAQSFGASVHEIRLKFLSGETVFEEGKLSTLERNVVYLSGFTVNRLNAGVSSTILAHGDGDSMARRLGATFYLWNRIMPPFAWIQGLWMQNDLTKSRDLTSPSSSRRNVVYALYGAIIATDILLNTDTVMAMTDIFLGKSPEHVAAETRFSIMPVAGGAIVGTEFSY